MGNDNKRRIRNNRGIIGYESSLIKRKVYYTERNRRFKVKDWICYDVFLGAAVALFIYTRRRVGGSIKGLPA
jgi:hypothetical protein